MMRRRAVMRRGPGLVGTVARTAVIAGTATAVSGAMINHQQGKQQEAAEEAAAQQQNQADMQAMQEQMAAMQAQQVQAAIPPAPVTAPPPPPAPAAAPQTDMVAQLKQLADLKTAGVLSDEEFQAAKAKLLAA